MRPISKNRKNNAGFTLLEISMVVVIGLMILGLSIPSMRGLFAEQRLRERMENFQGFVSRAALLAVQSKQEVRLCWEKEGIRIVSESQLVDEALLPAPGEDFFSLDKEESVVLTRTAARDPNALAEWSFWKEGFREPVEIAYAGPGGAWSLRFGALIAEPEVLEIRVR